MPDIRMYGTAWCSDCKRAKKFFGEHRVQYDYVDVDADEDGLRLVERTNGGKRIIPTIFFPDGAVLVEPTNAELAAQLGLQTKPECAFYDLVIVGGGPAGLTAALYGAREGLEVLVIERSGLGGQSGVTDRLDNFPGFPEGISGAEFADRLVAQCRRFGVELLQAAEVASVGVDGEYKVTTLADGTTITSAAVLVAPGSTYKRLGVPGEDDFIGAGVHFCATCDGPFYRDQDVLVIGGGNSAVEESIFLTRFARTVTIVARGPQLTASAVVVDKARENPKISFRYGEEVAEFRGNGSLSSDTGDLRPAYGLKSLVLRDRASGELSELAPSGVFVFIGLAPNTEALAGSITLNSARFIVTDETLQTSVPGVYAAGDARQGSTKQLVSAAGEGATAALMIRQYLERRGDAPRIGELAHEQNT